MSDEPLLLTPGPLTTSAATKAAMGRDWGSRDTAFIELNAGICRQLEAIAGVDQAKQSHICVPLQGSGTFVVEAAITTLVPEGGKVLVLVNGAYGQRMVKICDINRRAYTILETAENVPPSPDQLAQRLKAEPDISHVAAVHCETTSGILNPIAEIAEVVAAAGRLLLIDAMSSFGALPLDLREIPCAALIASSNKCLEGVPGVGFAIIDKNVLAKAQGNARSLSLDLYDQWRNLKKTGQWRFTPPTHVLAALAQALAEHAAAGGVPARGQRYQENCETLIAGMRALGFASYLPPELQAPIIATFLLPAGKNFEFEVFYAKLHARGFAIYPGKLTAVDSFRIGCIGQLSKTDMANAVSAIAAVSAEMNIKLR